MTKYISKIVTPAGTEYELKDSVARSGYELASGSSNIMKNRTVNYLELTGSPVQIRFPAAVEGHARDFLLYLTVQTQTQISIPLGINLVGDDLTTEAQHEYMVAFTELPGGKFYVRKLDIGQINS